MDIRILVVSLLLTVLFYLGLIVVRYFKGKWQWLAFYPGKIIFPKRIKKMIRGSVLCCYRVVDFNGLKNLEDYVEEYLMSRKVTWVDFGRYSISAGNNPLSEDNFKYFLFLKQASIMLQEDRKNGLRADIAQGVNKLREINSYFSKMYVRKALKTSDRNVILSEALYRVMHGSSLPLPYAHESYTLVRDEACIARNESMIQTLAADLGFVSLARDLKITNSSVYQKEALTYQHAILFHLYLLLLIKWQ